MALNPRKKARLEAELKNNTVLAKRLTDQAKLLRKRNFDIRKELENG